MYKSINICIKTSYISRKQDMYVLTFTVTGYGYEVITIYQACRQTLDILHFRVEYFHQFLYTFS